MVFGDDLYEKVLQNIGKRVRVDGLVHRNADSPTVDRITDVRSIESLPDSNELPSLTSLMGLFQDCPIDVGSGWDEP